MLNEFPQLLERVKKWLEEKDLSREVAEQITKLLKVNNKAIKLENVEGKEISLDPNGVAIISDKDGHVKTRLLVNFEPTTLCLLLDRLIPELKENLNNKKQTDEDILEKLKKMREALNSPTLASDV